MSHFGRWKPTWPHLQNWLRQNSERAHRKRGPEFAAQRIENAAVA